MLYTPEKLGRTASTRGRACLRRLLGGWDGLNVGSVARADAANCTVEEAGDAIEVP